LSGLPYATIYPEFLQSRPRCRECDLARSLDSENVASLWRFPCRSTAIQFALRLYADARTKLEFDADFCWNGHTADGLEHSPRCGWSRSALHREWPLELERRRGDCPSEFRNLSVSLRLPSARSSLTLPPLQGGSASSDLYCACRSAVSRLIHRQKQGPAGSMPTLWDHSPRCADRFARIGFLVQ